jgi:hypothetical protein
VVEWVGIRAVGIGRMAATWRSRRARRATGSRDAAVGTRLSISSGPVRPAIATYDARRCCPVKTFPARPDRRRRHHHLDPRGMSARVDTDRTLIIEVSR